MELLYLLFFFWQSIYWSMAASANPAGKDREVSANGNGATTNGSSAPHDNAVVGPTQTALRHNPGLAVEWTADEQSLLDELLTKSVTLSLSLSLTYSIEAHM